MYKRRVYIRLGQNPPEPITVPNIQKEDFVLNILLQVSSLLAHDLRASSSDVGLPASSVMLSVSNRDFALGDDLKCGMPCR